MAIDLHSPERIRVAQASASAGIWAPAASRLGVEARKFLSPGALIESLRRNLAAEEDRWLPWAVVAFAGGDAFYFSLPAEPAMWMAVAAAVLASICVATVLKTGGVGLRFACILLAAMGFGFSAAKLRTDMVAAPVLSRELGPLRIEGRVESVSDLTKGQRVIFAPSRVGRSGNQPIPQHLRLTLRNTKTPPNLEPGQWVDENNARVETVAEARGMRPWVAPQYRRTRPTKRP